MQLTDHSTYTDCVWFTPCLHMMLTPDTRLLTAVTAASLWWRKTAHRCVSPRWNKPSLVSDDSAKLAPQPPPLPHGPQQLWFLCEWGGSEAEHAMHQNAFAAPLITQRCLRNNRLDWISHPFFSTLIHLAVAWSHWQPNACDWRVRGGGGGQKKRRKSRGERTSLKDEDGMWKSGWLKWEEVIKDAQASLLSLVLQILSFSLWKWRTV